MFTDVSPDRWSYKDIERVVEAGIMSGYPDGTFRPEKEIAREEIASLVARLTFRICLLDGVLPKILPAVFTMYRGDGGSGTGFFISPGGLLITAKHVVTGEQYFTAMEGLGYSTKLVAVSPAEDIALMRATVPGPVPYLKIAPNDALYHGKHIAVVGSPKGYSDSVAQGVVSAPIRESVPAAATLGAFQTDAAINPGNSGGPIIDGNGAAVGIAVWKFAEVATEGMAFAVRCDKIREFCKSNGITV